ncbi:MarR family transcriptional regulator [Nitratireductor mangrovi]|uniref:MarR family transcriptional regulator n=1 Tax=Nitratireductor mangrovi TaxID=2599600 RepID=A0A5B8KYB8_9HYPH|nr:MarR family transcriptional regulator [Nitratireductor mangrovi]QDZ00551.1 MarR family transcriptional regulator [Nitratireductor mangrovi]
MTEHNPRAKPGPAKPPQTGDIELGLLSGYIGYHLRLAQNASFRAFQSKSGRDDLRPGWFAVLSLIGDNPGIAPMALSRAAGRDKSTLTPILRDLAKHGYVVSSPRPGDRRSYGLSLTELGRERFTELAAHAKAHDRVLDEIAGDQKDDLIRILKRIAEELA